MKKSNNNWSIPNEKIKDGVYLTRNYAKYFLDQSKKLYDKQEYQASIPFAILAFEEIKKCRHLFYFMSYKKDILKEDWHKLTLHEFKSTGIEKEQKRDLEKDLDPAFSDYISIFEKIGIFVLPNKKFAIAIQDMLIKLQRKFSKIKEMCFYSRYLPYKHGFVAKF